MFQLDFYLVFVRDYLIDGLRGIFFGILDLFFIFDEVEVGSFFSIKCLVKNNNGGLMIVQDEKMLNSYIFELLYFLFIVYLFD